MELLQAVTLEPNAKLPQVAPILPSGIVEVVVSKQGELTPEAVRRFIIETKRDAPGLTYAQIALGVAGKFGSERKVDRSTVGRILRKSGFSGHRPSTDAVLPTIPEVWPKGFLSRNKETMRGEAALRWTTDGPQQPNEEFTLDLGTEMPLRSVKFLQGLQHQWDCPKVWKVVLSDEKQIVWEVDGERIIEVELDEPVPIRWIGVVIVQPRMATDHPPATCWAVDNIELR